MGWWKTYTALCKLTYRRGVQKNFKNISCTMEHSDGSHQQVEKIRHHNDVTMNRISPKNWLKDKTETYQRGCQEISHNVKESPGKHWHCLHATTISNILHMSGLWGRVARWKAFLTRKKIWSHLTIFDKTSPNHVTNCAVAWGDQDITVWACNVKMYVL